MATSWPSKMAAAVTTRRGMRPSEARATSLETPSSAPLTMLIRTLRVHKNAPHVENGGFQTLLACKSSGYASLR